MAHVTARQSIVVDRELNRRYSVEELRAMTREEYRAARNAVAMELFGRTA